MHPPVRDVTKPLGEWNSVRLIVRGTHVEHWMNDVKLLEYELCSPDWAARVKASKFDKIPLYGTAKCGRIATPGPRGPGVVPEHKDSAIVKNATADSR